MNDMAAKEFLLDSLDQSLHAQIRKRLRDNDPFTVTWLQLIKSVQSTSIERFEDIKARIKSRDPAQFAG